MLGASLPPLVRNKRKGHPLGGLFCYVPYYILASRSLNQLRLGATIGQFHIEQINRL